MSVRKRKWTTRLGEAREGFVADWADAAGRHSRLFKRKKDAQDFLLTVKGDIKRGVHTSGKATVVQAGAAWLADAEDRLEPATVESYKQHLEQHIVPLIGSLKLAELTVPAVRAFMDRLRNEGRSPAMVKRVVGDLGSILSDAMERGTVAQNVVRSLSRRRKGKHAEQRYRLKIGVDIPSSEEIRAIIAHLPDRWRPILLTAIFTGLRASELRGLIWDLVDLKRAILHVTQRADKFNTIGKPKSRSGHRDVPMPPLLVKTLREWKLRCPKSESGLVFPTGAGEIEYHSNIVTRGLIPAQIAAGVVTKDGKAKYTGLHALRHFYASWCINRVEDGGLGLPIKVVQHRLGHNSITMTSDVYGHLFPSGDDGAELAAAEKALVG
jgi:integrase